jgi:hypothetical protein
MPQIRLEGHTIDQLLALPNDDFVALILTGKPLAFSAGSATILAQFSQTPDTLILELAHIDAGGEGALPAIASLASQYAKRQNIPAIQWRVHAVNCANPNLKLRRLLLKRGFTIRTLPDTGECYYLHKPTNPT